MASEEDLAEVMRNALERSGDLALLRVQLEDKVAALPNRLPSTSLSASLTEGDVSKPTMPNEVFLVNELIREYLRLTGCNQTASVLSAECGLPAEPMSTVLLRKAVSFGKKIDKPELVCAFSMQTIKTESTQQQEIRSSSLNLDSY